MTRNSGFSYAGTVASHGSEYPILDHAYTEAEIANAGEAFAGKTELDALIAYLQNLGNHTDFNALDTPATATTSEVSK